MTDRVSYRTGFAYTVLNLATLAIVGTASSIVTARLYGVVRSVALR